MRKEEQLANLHYRLYSAYSDLVKAEDLLEESKLHLQYQRDDIEDLKTQLAETEKMK